MTYELAKKLKESGFPINDTTLIKGFADGFYPFPTLSELIKACGNNLGELSQDQDNDWTARSRKINGVDGDICCCEDTPEESVANLWLALNKK